jgi:hypothetical protein
MMSKNPPAFPSEQHETLGGTWNQTYCDGMSLRDYFAGQVMTAAFNATHGNDYGRDGNDHMPLSAKMAYRYADAMLAERAKPTS